MILAKDQLTGLLDHLSTGQARLYVPARVDATSRFALYGPGIKTAFNLVSTMMPPKDLLFPQTQKMYRYGFDAEGVPFIDPVHDDDEVIAFGLRPCDMASIDCMDEVFLTKGYADEFYTPRREKLLTVVIGCTAPAETCFCSSMGGATDAAPTADIQLNETTDGAAYTVKAHTEKGEAALSDWETFTSDGDGDPIKASCSLVVSMDGIKEKLDTMYDHPLWERIARKCVTCGTCTYVCPTCHCFDIGQNNRMKEGERFRSWDSCMFSSYTLMAGHHNPRADKMPRVRQRFLHKLCFFEDRYGRSLCVGCGRCVEKCPVALDITELIDEIGALDLPSATDASRATDVPRATDAPGATDAPPAVASAASVADAPPAMTAKEVGA
ncbi:MAG: 4Fe-4S dicluster domain-containing protein [Coriobacteriales bacterium]|jgi:ferredoxin|nr:4Fe-4S dicluster domain-containing protein [Coriobacteriales bacterium]